MNDLVIVHGFFVAYKYNFYHKIIDLGINMKF